MGAPLAGAVIDHHSPAWGYAIAGSAGLLLAAAGALAGHHAHRPPAAQPAPKPAARSRVA